MWHRVTETKNCIGMVSKVDMWYPTFDAMQHELRKLGKGAKLKCIIGERRQVGYYKLKQKVFSRIDEKDY